jgi:spectinomycin phosphotransferase
MAKPELPADVLRAALLREFAIDAAELAPLSHGVDTEAAGLRVRASDGSLWFAKLRRGRFAEVALALPAFLAASGIHQVVAPREARDQRLCASLGELELAVYPFAPGANGMDLGLSDAHWLALGRAVRRIHDTPLPAALAERIRRVGPTRFAGALRELLARGAAELADHRARLDRTLDVLERGQGPLGGPSRELAICHSDLHAANLLLASDGGLVIVDWDEPILAPRERDLMFVGGGYYGNRRSPEEETAMFRRGYGEAAIDPERIRFFRCERAIEDLVLDCEDGTPDSRRRIANILAPGIGSLDRALASD